MVDFAELLSKRDVIGCQKKIQALAESLPNDVLSWEETLVSLAGAIAHYFYKDALQAILSELPPSLLEPFYIRLLNTEKLSADIIFDLTGFIITKKDLRDAHAINLLRLLLFSPYPIERKQLITLTERLDAQCLGKFLLELRENAFQGHIEGVKKNVDGAAEDNYQFKYQIFLTALTLDANSSAFKLPMVIQNNPFLANLIIIKRISCANPENYNKIINELMMNAECYDWQDPRFKDAVLPVFKRVLTSLDQKEANRLLSRYGQLAHSGHPSTEDRVRLVDQFYFTNDSIEKLLHFIQTLAHQDPTFIINFLTLTAINNKELKEKLLALIDIEAFPGLIGHLYVLGKISLENHEPSGIFECFIRVFCQKLKALKSKEELMHGFAEQYQYLPETAQLQLMSEMNKQLADRLSLQVQWLLTVKKIQAGTSVLWPFYDELIKAYPDRHDILQPLLKALTQEDLLELYVYLVKKKAPPESYHGFQQLFSNTENTTALFFLMSNTPAIPQELLSGFVDSLDDSRVIALLDRLIQKKIRKQRVWQYVKSSHAEILPASRFVRKHQ